MVTNDQEVAQLVAAARDVEILPEPTRRPLPNGLLWRLVDAIGRFAIPVALGAAIVGFGISSIGPEWAWASLLYLVTTLLLILYIPAMLRTNNREQEAAIRAAREKQEAARAEIARIVLEQSQQEENSSPQNFE